MPAANGTIEVKSRTKRSHSANQIMHSNSQAKKMHFFILKFQQQGEFQIDNFLGHQQYDDKGVRRYEFMYGETFISPGGAKTNREFLQKMNVKSGDRVLDVACGMGGACFQFAQEFGAHVYGFDLSSSMIAAGKQYLASMPDDIKEKVTQFYRYFAL